MIEVEYQGQVFNIKDTQRKPVPEFTPSKRGTIQNFSAASRRRLINLLCRMDLTGWRVTFVSLTFHSTPSHAEAKAAFKRFLQRCREYWPEASAVWRMEYQERGSIHFHLMFFNLPYWPQDHLQDTWTECTDEVRSIVDIRKIYSFRRYVGYISKYIAKVDTNAEATSLENGSYQQNTPSDKPGRFWGYLNKPALPLAELCRLWIDDDDLGHYAMWTIKAMSRGRSGESAYSQTVYSMEAQKMYLWLCERARVIYPYRDFDTVWHEKPRQWFGSPAVLGGIGVPLAG